MEAIINSSRGFRLVELLLRCLGFGKENVPSLFCSNRELDREILPKNLPAADRDADSSPPPASDSSPSDPPLTITAPREEGGLEALTLPSVPTPRGSTGSGGQHN